MSGEHENTGNNTGTEGNGNNTEGNESEGNYIATMERGYDVIIDSKGNYTLYLPIPVNETGISYIMDNLTLESGNCTYRIENTTYGLALNITGRGHVMLSAEAVYTMYVENWKVVNTSGVNPETHPITLSMSNITYIHDSGYDYTNATGYNTTKIPFKIPQYRKDVENNGELMAFPFIYVHSFVYLKSEKPVEIQLTLYEGIGTDRTTWELWQKFDMNGWHYVELNTGTSCE